MDKTEIREGFDCNEEAVVFNVMVKKTFTGSWGVMMLTMGEN